LRILLPLAPTIYSTAPAVKKSSEEMEPGLEREYYGGQKLGIINFRKRKLRAFKVRS
jgi:hypothetical protein